MNYRTEVPVRSSWEIRTLGGNGLAWDSFVARQVDSSFCHLAGWRAVMTEVLDNECEYLQASRPDGEIEGVLPLVHVRSRLFGRFLVSMPFLNYGGPLGSSATRSLLVDKALTMARARSVDLLEIRARDSSVPPLSPEDRRITVLLPLPESPDELWQQFSSKLRSQIRRPLKAGFEASFGTHQLDEFYAVFSHTMRDLGTPVLPRRFFSEIVKQFGGMVALCVVKRQDGEPVAAGLGFEWAGEVEITWAGALREFSTDAPNMLLYWSFMQESMRRGSSMFNFGRCRPQGGTHRFKLQWGGRDERLHWSIWPNGQRRAPSPDSSRYGTAMDAWRKLPLVIANQVGPFLSRRLP
jgi:serine/alanine adding enzyme